MVATRRAAKKAPEDAPAASSTLKAPPKRGGKKKAAVEHVVEAAPTVPEPAKKSTAKRKATEEPEAAELPAAKKPAANTKATRAPKSQTPAEPAPTVAKRATRGRKATEPATMEEPATIEDAPKPASTRTRKVSAKKTPATVEEPVFAEPAVAEEAPKPASRARKAPVKKAAAPKKVEVQVEIQIENTIAAEPVKPAPRGRRAAVAKEAAPTPAPAPVLATRATRGRNVAILPQDSPLKAPARKPAKKAAATAVAKPVLEPMEEAFAQFPQYPTTPAHITAPINARLAMKELPQYPNTPAHIFAPISTKDAMLALPGYPKTPAHIRAPMTAKTALAELPDYPKTPAHITAPINAKDAMAELPGYPKTPAHITMTAKLITVEEEDVVKDLSNESNGSPQVNELIGDNTTEQLLTHQDIESNVQAPLNSIQSPKTPALDEVMVSSNEEHAPQDPATPPQATTPFTDVATDFFRRSQIPAEIVWGVTNQEAFAEMPAYPRTPVHIRAPVSTREALAELPSYPTTPAMAMEAAIQEEITASVKKQTPSPLRFPGLEDVSFQFAETSEYTDVDLMVVDTEVPAVEVTQRMPLAPLQLAPSIPMPEPVSPKKSALRSPQKMDAKTPKKAVTWDDPEESELFLYDGPLQGMTFYVDVTSNGKDQNYLFAGLLEDLGAKTIKEWNENSPSHVLFKDGSKRTLEKVVASKGSIKCVNVGWVLESERNKKRMEESPYLVDLSAARPASPLPTTSVQPFTPARTPSKYALPPSSECKSIPTTPTSSEFDRSFNFDDKENSEHGIYFDEPKQVRTVPPKKSSFLLSRSPIKSPSKPSFLLNTPVRPMSAMKPFSTTQKRFHESSFAGISLAPPKKFRLF